MGAGGSGLATKPKKKKPPLRGGLDPRPVEDVIDTEEAALRVLKEEKDKLRSKLCSEAWIDDVARDGRRAYAPVAQCRCDVCVAKKHYGWPLPVTGLVEVEPPPEFCWWPRHEGPRRRVSYECHFEAKVPDPDEPPTREDFVNRWQPVTATAAITEGLTIQPDRRRASEPAQLLTSGCEMCDGLKKNGMRFCTGCWASIKKQLGDKPLSPQEVAAIVELCRNK